MEGNNRTINISTSTLVRVIILLLVVVLAYVLREIIIIFLVAIVVASFVDAAAYKFSRFKSPRMLSVVIIYFTSISFLAWVFYLLTPLFLSEAAHFAEFMSKYFPSSDLFQNSTISGAKDFVANLTYNISFSDFATMAQKLASGVSGGFVQSISLFFGGIMNIVLIVVISFYLSIQEKGIENFLRIVLPQKNEEYVIGLWQRSQRKIALWIKGQLLLALLIGILVYLGLSLFGVQYALLIALATAIAEMIPFGLTLIAVPAVILAYTNDGTSTAIIVALFYIILHQFETYLLQPLIVKKVVGISPLVVVLALLIGFTLAGFWGIVLGIPVAVLLLEILNDMEKRKIFERNV